MQATFDCLRLAAAAQHDTHSSSCSSSTHQTSCETVTPEWYTPRLSLPEPSTPKFIDLAALATFPRLGDLWSSDIPDRSEGRSVDRGLIAFVLERAEKRLSQRQGALRTILRTPQIKSATRSPSLELDDNVALSRLPSPSPVNDYFLSRLLDAEDDQSTLSTASLSFMAQPSTSHSDSDFLDDDGSASSYDYDTSSCPFALFLSKYEDYSVCTYSEVETPITEDLPSIAVSVLSGWKKAETF